ncbi:VWA domain-containing protein [Nocardioides piscis]|uniref:VWA domain-containing protein n=1 Tax=Nocardioides piscis TaxID=2714938 RepID=A0A6G7YDD7_9ACTN|nr:VWA domain-containing protein [Nocardioides piscis]QIK74739.1 VWA domain-containing protein [Nocardioides piscis]
MFGSHLHNDTDDHREPAATQRSASRRVRVGVVTLILIGTLGWAGAQALGGDESAGVNCQTSSVNVAVAPAMADLVEEAVDSLSTDSRCVEINVTTATVADVAVGLEEAPDDDSALPDLWVPDSPAWHSVLVTHDRAGTVLVPTLATTPVALAGGIKEQAGAAWSDVLASPHLEISDPSSDGASAMALVTPFGEGDPTAAQETMVPLAQRFGDNLASGTVGKVTVDNLELGSAKMVPVTERDFLIAKRGNDSLQWRVPGDGFAVLNYPLVQVAEPVGVSFAINSAAGVDVVARTGERIADWFKTTEGVRAIAEDHLRGPDGAPLPESQDASAEKQLATVPQTQVDAVIKRFNALKVPSSILALVETSDSMATQFGVMSKIELAADASKTALEVFPDAVRLGFRVFSTNQAPNGQDWREVAPLRRLDAPVGPGRIHKDLLKQQIDALPSQTRGGAGLYDSILAAYQEAVRQYNPYYQNSLVIFTDGPNDDPASISLEELKLELQKMQNPDRPVRIIAIGLSADADLGSLQQIAATSEENAYYRGAHQVLQPGDILNILASTLLSR